MCDNGKMPFGITIEHTIGNAQPLLGIRMHIADITFICNSSCSASYLFFPNQTTATNDTFMNCIHL